jgi:hypothetical protein
MSAQKSNSIYRIDAQLKWKSANFKQSFFFRDGVAHRLSGMARCHGYNFRCLNVHFQKRACVQRMNKSNATATPTHN